MCKSKGITKPAGEVKASDGGGGLSGSLSDPGTSVSGSNTGLMAARTSRCSQAPGSRSMQRLQQCGRCVLRAPQSMHAMTRKIVNYAWRGRSPRKLGWRPVAVVTCKSMVSVGHRGERPIELSSSWFHPKFLSG